MAASSCYILSVKFYNNYSAIYSSVDNFVWKLFGTMTLLAYLRTCHWAQLARERVDSEGLKNVYKDILISGLCKQLCCSSLLLLLLFRHGDQGALEGYLHGHPCCFPTYEETEVWQVRSTAHLPHPIEDFISEIYLLELLWRLLPLVSMATSDKLTTLLVRQYTNQNKNNILLLFLLLLCSQDGCGGFLQYGFQRRS